MLHDCEQLCSASPTPDRRVPYGYAGAAHRRDSDAVGGDSDSPVEYMIVSQTPERPPHEIDEPDPHRDNMLAPSPGSGGHGCDVRPSRQPGPRHPRLEMQSSSPDRDPGVRPPPPQPRSNHYIPERRGWGAPSSHHAGRIPHPAPRRQGRRGTSDTSDEDDRGGYHGYHGYHHGSGGQRSGRDPPGRGMYTTRRQPLALDKFDGVSREWEDYQEHLGQVAGWNGWTEAETVMQLGAALRPPASTVMRDLAPSQKQNLSLLTQALSSRFAPQGRQVAYRTDYYNRVQIKGESVDDFGRALKYLYRKAFPLKDIEGDEYELVERYSQGLWYENVQEDVRRAKCHTLDEAITTAIEGQSIAKAIRSRKSRLAAAILPTGAPDDGTPAPTAAPLSATATSEGQMKALIASAIKAEMQRQSREDAERRRQRRADATCYLCQRKGHFRAECKSRPAEQSPPWRGRRPPTGNDDRRRAPAPPPSPPQPQLN